MPHLRRVGCEAVAPPNGLCSLPVGITACASDATGDPSFPAEEAESVELRPKGHLLDSALIDRVEGAAVDVTGGARAGSTSDAPPWAMLGVALDLVRTITGVYSPHEVTIAA